MGMTYINPIEIAEKMSNQIEKDIIKVVFSYGIKVDKDELVKALSYDRKQYEIGYADGQRAGERTAKVETVEKPNVFKCSECGQYFHSTSWGSPVEYCSRCGCRLIWRETEHRQYAEKEALLARHGTPIGRSGNDRK